MMKIWGGEFRHPNYQRMYGREFLRVDFLRNCIHVISRLIVFRDHIFFYYGQLCSW